MTNPIKNNRIEWVDIAKTICIVCVIATHCTYCNDKLRIIFHPFFLTLFFFLSGYLFNEKYSFKETITKKFRTLFVPWLIFGVINVLLVNTWNIIRNGLNMKSFVENFALMFLQIRGFKDREWFIACLFLAFIPFYFIIKKLDKKGSIIVSFVLALISMLYVKYVKLNVFGLGTNSLPWHIQIIFIVDFLMVLGFYYRKEWESKIKISNISLFVLIIIYLAIAFSTYRITNSLFSINEYNVNIMLWYLEVLLGIFIQLEICKRIKINKVVSFLGRNTLIIFCLHHFCLRLLDIIFSFIKLDGFFKMNLITNIIGIDISIIFTLLVLILPIIIIHKYFPFIIGEKADKMEEI